MLLDIKVVPFSPTVPTCECERAPVAFEFHEEDNWSHEHYCFGVCNECLSLTISYYGVQHAASRHLMNLYTKAIYEQSTQSS